MVQVPKVNYFVKQTILKQNLDPSKSLRDAPQTV